MPTIYTLGDPQLIREALMALATIFNLVEWSDPGSAMNLGGNMLAVALIGLIAIAIAGVTSQQVRVDYLFLALILFGIAFGTETDVNIEDIQTGDTAIVADIPIGIAYVAAAASGVAYSLTETTSTALQRVGSETSILSEGGFMDPLKVLLSLRTITFEDTATHVHRSLMEYYRICVGRTIAAGSTLFDMDAFKMSDDPMDYLLGGATVLNFSTTYYSDANPNGIAQGCIVTGAAIQADILDLTTGTEDGIEAYLARKLGPKEYNTAYSLTDVEDSVDILFRSALVGQNFMARLMLRNFHNTGEAYRLSEYGSNQAQYVATVTEAFETQRVEVATKGSVFLQFMIPLMTFFQFVFFALAPFIALVMIANPFAAGKTLGLYLLFGAWSFMWMPIAAIINHYMQISVQNAVEFAGTGALNTGYTSLLGFDDFYNIVTTKIAIGSGAMASTPVIVAAILTGSVMGISSMAGRMSQGGTTNTSVAAPSLVKNGAVVQVGGRFSAPNGATMEKGGVSGAMNEEARAGFRSITASAVASNTLASATDASNRAGESLNNALRESNSTLNSVIQSGGRGGAFTSQFQASGEQVILNALDKNLGIRQGKNISSAQLQTLSSHVGIPALFAGISESSADSVLDARTYEKAEQWMQKNAASLSTAIHESVGATAQSTGSETGTIQKSAASLREATTAFESSQEYLTKASEVAQSANQLGLTTSIEAAKLAEFALRSDKDAAAKLDSYLTVGSGDAGFAASIIADRDEMLERMKPTTLDGTYPPKTQRQHQIAATFATLADRGQDPRATALLIGAMEKFSGIGGGGMADRLQPTHSNLSTVGQRLDDGRNLSDTADSRVNDFVDILSGETNSTTRGAQSRISAGGKSPQVIGASERDAVSSAYGELSESHGTTSGPSQGDFDSQKQRFDDMLAGIRTANTVSGALNDWAKPIAGFNDLLEGGVFNDVFNYEVDQNADPQTRNAQEAQLASMSLSAVTQLEGAILGQQQPQRAAEVQPTYQRWLDAKFTPRRAMAATYGEIGAREQGVMDTLVGGGALLVGGGAAGGKGTSVLGGFSRVLGAGAGLALYAGAVGISKGMSAQNAKEAEARVAEMLIADFKDSGGQHADKFEELIRAANGGEQVFQVIDAFYEQGFLTDKNLQALDEARKPGFLEKVGEAYYKRAEYGMMD